MVNSPGTTLAAEAIIVFADNEKDVNDYGNELEVNGCR
jgi:hypothetical protein